MVRRTRYDNPDDLASNGRNFSLRAVLWSDPRHRVVGANPHPVCSHATNRPDGRRNIAAMFVAVMLRLRAGYVSKAAILTSPGHSVPVGNQSFA